jgi:hypothetical protein
MREVECEMAPEVESAEQRKAWVAWCLDDNASRRRFEPVVAPAWLAEGRQHLDLLPWKRRMAAYYARPHCFVQRDWARVALKALGEQLKTVDDEALVTFGFAGNVLTISCAGKVSPMPAEGSPWTQPYSIRAGVLRSLPKRLMSWAIHEVARRLHGSSLSAQRKLSGVRARSSGGMGRTPLVWHGVNGMRSILQVHLAR